MRGSSYINRLVIELELKQGENINVPLRLKLGPGLNYRTGRLWKRVKRVRHLYMSSSHRRRVQPECLAHTLCFQPCGRAPASSSRDWYLPIEVECASAIQSCMDDLVRRGGQIAAREFDDWPKAVSGGTMDGRIVGNNQPRRRNRPRPLSIQASGAIAPPCMNQNHATFRCEIHSPINLSAHEVQRGN